MVISLAQIVSWKAMFRPDGRLYTLLLCCCLPLVRPQAACSYRQYIEPGRIFSVNNPGYPGTYRSYAACDWEAYTSTGAVVNVNCHRMDLVKNYYGNCLDNLMVTINGITTPYCKPFTVSANKVELSLIGTTSRGGYFQCTFKASVAETPKPTPQPENCDCGWNRKANKIRVVGGVETDVHEFPSMAAFVNVRSRSMWCGATIISRTAAVTAAHCLAGKSPSDYGLLVGEHNVDTGSDTNATNLLRVARFIVHQNYNMRTQANDIALAVTSTPIEYSEFVGPACLPFFFETPTYRLITVTGWGLDEFGGSVSSFLKKAELKLVPHNYCLSTYDEYNPMSQMCTYERGKDACQYDSGGPLYDYNSDKKQFIVAIVSYGRDCGRLDPAVNTKVSAYLDWIQSQLPRESFCKKSQ